MDVDWLDRFVHEEAEQELYRDKRMQSGHPLYQPGARLAPRRKDGGTEWGGARGNNGGREWGAARGYDGEEVGKGDKSTSSRSTDWKADDGWWKADDGWWQAENGWLQADDGWGVGRS